MHPVKTIAIGLLAWPAAEIVAFFCVVAAVGFINAIILIVLMSAAGAAVLRHFGSARQQRMEAAGGFISASVWSGELAPGLTGILLLIPGFLTSVLGIAILFPLSRRWLAAGFQRLFAARERRQPPAHPDVIDLAPGEWQSLSGEKLPPSGRPAEK
jgi:UPF0716 family protein affecting phage T7 exclusion